MAMSKAVLKFRAMCRKTFGNVMSREKGKAKEKKSVRMSGLVLQAAMCVCVCYKSAELEKYL